MPVSVSGPRPGRRGPAHRAAASVPTPECRAGSRVDRSDTRAGRTGTRAVRSPVRLRSPTSVPPRGTSQPAAFSHTAGPRSHSSGTALGLGRRSWHCSPRQGGPVWARFPALVRATNESYLAGPPQFASPNDGIQITLGTVAGVAHPGGDDAMAGRPATRRPSGQGRDDTDRGTRRCDHGRVAASRSGSAAAPLRSSR
jgi:hypothetical protein